MLRRVDAAFETRQLIRTRLKQRIERAYPSLAIVPIALTDRPGQRALWRRFALEGPFGARRASCGWFGVRHGIGGGEKEPLS